MEKKIQNLVSYCNGMHNKENGKTLYDKYLDEIKTITPEELMYVQNEQLKSGLSPDEILESVDKLINVFYESLSKHQLTEPIIIPFIHYLNEENKALKSILDDFKIVMKQEQLNSNPKFIKFIYSIKEYNEHLLKLENVFFPYLEKSDNRFNGLQILWALHDETRTMIKEIESLFKTGADYKLLSKKTAYLYFNLYGLIQKQELILFPASVKFIKSDEFDQMHMQSFDYAFPYIAAPKKPSQNTDSFSIDAVAGVFKTDNGQINLDVLSLIMDSLPMDITFVDANDEVAYFSKPKDRFFPRSKAAIGRNVRNCHPPKSVHIVEKILQSFKTGQKDEAKFWINIADKKVLIKYIAIRNESGCYIGTLEVVQEINDIQTLKGEKRLLDWE